MKNDYTNLSDNELIEAYNNLSSMRMYYMAAEGNWSSETEDRNANQKELNDCMAELKARGIEIT